MKIFNKTKDEVIAEDARELKNLKEKATGLLGYDDPEPIYFQTRWGIHTIGMNFPIDCIILGEDMTVRKIKKSLEPGKLFVWNPKHKGVIELPAGTIEETKTELSDKILIKENE